MIINKQILGCIHRQRLRRLLHYKTRIDHTSTPGLTLCGRAVDAVAAEVPITFDAGKGGQFDTARAAAVEVEGEAFADAAVCELAVDDGTTDTHDAGEAGNVCQSVWAHIWF